MNLSYSYYNQYNDDPNDDLYNAAVSINNKNKEGTRPFFNTQGSFQGADDDHPESLGEMSALSDFSEKEQHPRYLYSHKKDKHIDNNSISSEEGKIDHIKNCSHCRKKFLKLLRKSEKHVFPEDSDRELIKIPPPAPAPAPLAIRSPTNPVISRDILFILLIGLALLIIVDILLTHH
ncbi:MAG: hypothetical protein Harvfovirus10_11 [Harvfovirus sp.]|uniref:Uncharacterized protein n=1 Tax=Harvfovirus sp. TaxID=2487768 RepID=A0A3G5A518_9VIRU|nr:MAG: hypothetical protein Harvfovirus10_11 [Harvfovirus sp.]